MRMRGLEPPRGCPHGDLNAARLPIPPHPPAERTIASRTALGKRKAESFREPMNSPWVRGFHEIPSPLACGPCTHWRGVVGRVRAARAHPGPDLRQPRPARGRAHAHVLVVGGRDRDDGLDRPGRRAGVPRALLLLPPRRLGRRRRVPRLGRHVGARGRRLCRRRSQAGARPDRRPPRLGLHPRPGRLRRDGQVGVARGHDSRRAPHSPPSSGFAALPGRAAARRERAALRTTRRRRPAARRPPRGA